MNNNKKGILLLIPLTVLLASCASLMEVPTAEKIEKIDKIGLISTYLGIVKPSLPLIDAAILNGKTNSISGELIGIFETNIDQFRENAATSLKNNFNCEVIYGEKLQKSDGFDELNKTYQNENSLAKDDPNFPEILHATNDLNPFQFVNGDIDFYFNNSANYGNTIIDICQKLKLKYVAVVYSFLRTSPGSIVLPATVYLINQLYIFDDSGRCIATNTKSFSKMSRGSNSTVAMKLKPYEPESYQMALDNHPAFIDLTIKRVSQFFNK